MNIIEKLSCTYCYEIFKHPINLICCVKKIQLIKSKSGKIFIYMDFLNIKKLFESLIEEVELHKFKLDSKYELTFHNLRKEIESLEKFLNGPESYISEEIN